MTNFESFLIHIVSMAEIFASSPTSGYMEHVVLLVADHIPALTDVVELLRALTLYRIARSD